MGKEAIGSEDMQDRGHEIHPVANIFSMMPEPEFQRFKADIAAHGLRNRIMVDAEGRIIDGRHRYRALKELGREIPTQEWDGDGSDMVAVARLVMRLKLHRHHLNEAQRAMAAARLRRDVLEPAAKARMKAGKAPDPGANLPEAGDPLVSALSVGRSRDVAARLLNVSPRSVQDCVAVLDSCTSPLVDHVDQGKLPPSVAGKFARLLKEPGAIKIPDGATTELLVADPAWIRKQVKEAEAGNSGDARVSRPAGAAQRAKHVLKDLQDVVRLKQDLDGDLRNRLADACDRASKDLRLESQMIDGKAAA